MRTFLLRSGFFLILSLLITIGVFFWLNSTTVLPALTEQVQTFKGIQSPAQSTKTEQSPTVSNKSFTVPDGGVKLSTLSLGDSQKKVLETAGINTETFVITEAMITCGVGKLGEARANEIFAGATPSLIETGTLLPCLGR